MRVYRKNCRLELWTTKIWATSMTVGVGLRVHQFLLKPNNLRLRVYVVSKVAVSNLIQAQ